MPGLVKIGKTAQEDVQSRMKQLFSTGVPFPFDCVFACKVPDATKVEKAIHFAFGKDRINATREFFRIEPERIVAVLKLLHVEEVTTEVEKTIEAEATVQDLAAAAAYKKRRPRMDFLELGIPLGAVLQSKDGELQAVVKSGKTVLFEGEECSLTAATRKLLDLAPDYALQPSPYWTYEGKLLKQIYEDFHGTGSDE